MGNFSLDDTLDGSSNSAHLEPRLPPWEELSDLLDGYELRLWVLVSVHHLPTLRRRLARLVETTSQTLADYAACNLCPHTVRAVLWGAYTVLDRREEAAVWGDACRTGLLEWAARLGLFEDPATSTIPAADMFSFVKAGVIALLPHYLSDLSEEGAKLKQLLITAHRLARFGSEVADKCYLSKSEVGAEDGLQQQQPKPQPPFLIVGRDALDLTAWIDAEERVRASCQLLSFAQETAYMQGIPCSVHSGGYETSRGFVAGFYNDSALPCPDLLFRGLPSVPETEEEILAWYRLDPYSAAAYTPLSYGDAVSWPDLPAGSLQRKRMVQLLFGNYFQNGYSRNMVVFKGATLARLVTYRDFVKVREWKLHDPPQGQTPDEMRARAMYDGIMLQIADFFQHLPEPIRTADSLGDGIAMRKIAAQYWGRDFSFGVCTSLVNWHGVAISLYSPRDLVSTVASLPSSDDMEWTKSPSFVIAFSHALVSARIVGGVTSLGRLRANLEQEPQVTMTVEGGGPEQEEHSDLNFLSEDEFKTRHPLWPTTVLRVALAHVYCLRHLQTIIVDQSLGTWNPNAELLQTIGVSPEDLLSPDFINTLLRDISDCIDSITKSQREPLNNYAQLVQTVVWKVLCGTDISRREAEAVRLLRTADGVV